MSLPLEYVRLGLAFDRLESGFVDAYTGPAHIRAAVENEPAPSAGELARRARELLRELPSAGVSGVRAAWLSGQLTGLETSARVMAGEPVGFVEQVQRYFQVTPTMGDQAAYADARRALDGLLPGDGPLAERYEHYRTRTAAVPPEKLALTVDAMSSVLRAAVRERIGLPDGERVDYEVVGDKPWAGFNYYQGGLLSKVAINSDIPVGLGVLPDLIAHESYPGHHTEHVRKEAGLADHVETQVFLVNTPECLMAEGLADLGLRGLGMADHDWTDLYADLGIRYDAELGARIAEAAAALGAVRQDAALLLHDRGASVDDVVAYLQRWALHGPERAASAVRFVSDPLWRAYISTYVEGAALIGRWLDATPPDQVGARFRRLLDEQLTPAAIATELTPA